MRGADRYADTPLAVEVSGLRVSAEAGFDVVRDVSFEIGARQVLGLVGESGAGKTTTALALLGFAQPGLGFSRGSVRITEQLLDLGDEDACRAIRGDLVSYVPQDPRTALNPSTRVGHAVQEMITRSGATSSDVGSMLELVGLPADRSFQKRFPHELSGGQQQRLCIAVALACEPSVVVLDEPTTGLDVITQSVIIRELLRLRQDRGVAMLYVSHNLAVISEVADTIAVMYDGRIVETGPTPELLELPLHPYTRGLIEAIPDHREPSSVRGIPGQARGAGPETRGCAFAPRCSFRTPACDEKIPVLTSEGVGRRVRCIHVDGVRAAGSVAPGERRPAKHGDTESLVLRVQDLHASHRDSTREEHHVVRGVTFAVAAGECVALVGESGSGKTTIARTIVGLHPRSNGSVLIREQPVRALARHRTLEQRRAAQLVFQNPESALNPRQTAGVAIERAASKLGRTEQGSARDVEHLLEDVRLPLAVADRYPSELSGGEAQRVAIARALAARPEVLICDEVTSALDVSVQAAILELLEQLRAERRLGVLLITHDLGVVAAVADRVLVLDQGEICEEGRVDEILRSPEHPYTRSLIEAAPSLTAATGRV